MPAVSRHGVFISYARSDGDRLARDLRGRLEAAGVPLWRDRESMEGGRDWWLQITAALDAVEFMVLLMTPAAAASPLVRKEWRFARQRGVCVYPVLGGVPIDFEALPRWMRSVHFYDLDHEWPKLLNDLQTRCERRRVPFMVEDLPPEFVRRPAEYDQLLTHILDRDREEPIAITTALRAAGGFGKTVLARALCHDEDIQNAFDDGILWVTLGEAPGDLTGRVEDLIYVLSGERPGFARIEAATAVLVELLADRDVLMVVDDVWDASHLKPFLQGGPRCARVITTRMLDTLPADARRVDVDAMRYDEAVALVGHGLPGGATPALRALASRLGEWPLLLRLANAALRDRVQGGQSLPGALAYVNTALDRRGSTFFDARDAVARDQAVARTVDLSIERLTPVERARFLELAIFPEDLRIPFVTIQRLWARTGGLDDFDSEALCERLHRLSLTLSFDPTQRFVRLHDVIRQYLLQLLGERLAAVHNALLAAHRPASGHWADLPPDEPYLWDHLAFHVLGAAADADLIATVSDSRYLTAKTLARSALAAETDLLAAERGAGANEPLHVLRRSFVQAGHLLNRCDHGPDLAATLYSRLQHLDILAPVTTALASSLAAPHLRPRAPFPDLPHPALIRTVTGSSRSLWGCAVSADGSFIVSTSYDGGVLVWDARAATERRLSGHTGWVRRCAISPDGTFIVSASYDRRLRVWETATGAIRHVLAGHTDGVTDCAVSPDGAVIVSVSQDETIRMWDAATGILRQTIAAQWGEERGGWVTQRTPWGHVASIWGCAVSADGTLIASASSDQTVRVWSLQTGEELQVLSGHTSMVVGCAFSPDGMSVASAGADGTVRVWDRRTGAERFVLTGHDRSVNACAFAADGRWLVSASADRTVKLWDATTGRELATYTGHSDIVNDCAVAPDGTVVSVSLDGTMKLWSTSGVQEGRTPAPLQHAGWVNACAVRRTGTTAASASSDASIRLWDWSSGTSWQVLLDHTNSVRSCAFGPGPDQLVSASADKSLKVWNVRSGTVIATLLGHTDWVNACSVSPGGHLLLSASSDRTLRLWDTRSWTQRLRIVAHADSLTACRFAPSGEFFVSASADGTLKAWSLQRARDAWESLPLNHQRLTEHDWEQMLAPLVIDGHDRGVNDCAISSDSRFIVSASSDQTMRIWDAATGELRQRFTGHRSAVNGCALAPDDGLLASVSSDSTICIWSIDNGERLATLHVDGVLESCAWLPDGKGVVAVGAAGVYFLSWFPGT